MTNSTSINKIESYQHNLRIKVLMEKLKSKLKNFSVLDKQGFVMGQVKDVAIDSARQLNLVVSEADNYNGSRLFLLRSSHIQQVDSENKSAIVDLSKAEIDNLPEYKPSEKQDAKPKITTQKPIVIPSSISEMPPVTESKDDSPEYAEPLDVVEEEVIRLLEERLVVDLKKQKLGDVIVRKQVETRIVQVPVRREKLIVEQVGPDRRQLAEIDLGQAEEIAEVEPDKIATQDNQPTVSGVFNSPRTASLLLDAISKQRNHGCKYVRVEIVLEDDRHQQTYQEWFNRCSGQ
ncbi:YsnF/AvaK domain-containing protein [Microseira sp. BLCC-F43]|jgi:stress response protein YsnF|uniref:YsnF/AvaK domain-containing protein n=1 Tax=Microseira sp. BLCC-F43 TaxID=3153602 RepID=UPI0035BAC50E